MEALRRTALRKLPPVLIIHLKRFEFDLESMTKFKVRFYVHVVLLVCARNRTNVLPQPAVGITTFPPSSRNQVNDRCAFPMSLDMTPYTDEYLAAMEEVRDAAGTGAEGAAAGMTHFMSARGALPYTYTSLCGGW